MATLTPIFEDTGLQLGTAQTTIFTAAEKTVAFTLHLANTTAAAVTVAIHRRPNAAAAADSNALLKGHSIPANESVVLNCGNLKAATVISGLASAANSITASIISGQERV